MRLFAVSLLFSVAVSQRNANGTNYYYGPDSSGSFFLLNSWLDAWRRGNPPVGEYTDDDGAFALLHSDGTNSSGAFELRYGVPIE